MSFLRRVFTHLALVLVSSAALPASTMITVQSVTGQWYDAVPQTSAAIPTIVIEPAGVTTTASWGTPAESNKSGYTFSAASTLPSSVVLPPSPSGWVSLGKFNHFNWPINSGTSITSIKLDLSLNLQVDANPGFTQVFSYLFTHDETPNGANPCAYPDGPNANGCADAVFISAPTGGTFIVDGVEYTLQLSFSTTGLEPTSPITRFLTAERSKNIAQIYGRFLLPAQVTEEIPEPSTYALLGLGLLAIAFRRKLVN